MEMTGHNTFGAFQNPNAGAADNLDLVIRCYDAVIKDLEEAKSHHTNSQMDAAYDKIRHAQDILTELLVCLDYEKGGSISQNLGRIYNFILRELITIPSTQNTQAYGQLVHLLSELRSAWVQIRSQQSVIS
jgi:flagellar protein FliS